MQNVLGQAPKLHLSWVQYIARLRNEPVPDLHIYRHLLEAKVRIVHIVTTPRHEGVDMISTLIIPVCIGNWMSARSRGGKCYTHCIHGNKVSEFPRRGFEARQLIKFIQASITVNCGSPGSGPQPCASRKRTSSSCSIVYPAKILTILRQNRCELDAKGHDCNFTNLSAKDCGQCLLIRGCRWVERTMELQINATQ